MSEAISAPDGSVKKVTFKGALRRMSDSLIAVVRVPVAGDRWAGSRAGWTWLSDLLMDLRVGSRSLVKRPGQALRP